MNENKINHWLKENINTLFSSEIKRKEFSELLAEFNPEIKWETGPMGKGMFFAFSPNLKHELLGVTRQLCENTPDIEDWNFLPAKPRKQWKKRSIKLNRKGKELEVDFSNWRYYLTAFNGGEFFDIHYIPDESQQLNSEELNYFADLFSEFELGELNYIELIDKVHIDKGKKDASITNNVEDLYDHLMSIKQEK